MLKNYFQCFSTSVSLCFFLIGLSFLFASCGSNSIIVHDLEEADANEILVFLDANNIQAEKVRVTPSGSGGGEGGVSKWDIATKPSQAAAAMRLLNQQGLPKRPFTSIIKSYATNGLIPSEKQEEIKYHAILGEQLASIIRKYDGVLDADVEISFPKTNPLDPQKTQGKITAAVWIKHSGILDDPNSHLKSKIKRLVSSAISGLSYDNVTVIGERTNLGNELGSNQIEANPEKHYVETWGIVMRQHSLLRFRLIFFSLVVLLIFFALTLFWTFWHLWPALRKSGGLKALFNRKPITSPVLTEDNQPKTDETSLKKELPADDTAGKVDKNIDET